MSSTGLAGAVSLEAQQQMGTFFASNGTEIVAPEVTNLPGAFEVPIAHPLPEDLNFIP